MVSPIPDSPFGGIRLPRVGLEMSPTPTLLIYTPPMESEGGQSLGFAMPMLDGILQAIWSSDDGFGVWFSPRFPSATRRRIEMPALAQPAVDRDVFTKLRWSTRDVQRLAFGSVPGSIAGTAASRHQCSVSCNPYAKS